MMMETSLFLADSVATLFKLFPRALLGVILMFGGLELAAGARWNGGKDQAERLRHDREKVPTSIFPSS